MSVSHLSPSAQNYLKAIWALQEWGEEVATPSLIAARTGVKLSTVSDALRKLTEQGLLEHAPYGAITLTEEGRRYALTMVRRHRLIETFLVEILGYTWDQVHDEAETLEHAVSDFLVERLDEHLGRPRRDPHGDPIPTADGTITMPDAVVLSSVQPGTTVQVERICDADPDLLQFFSEHALGVGSVLGVQPGPRFSESLEISLPDGAGLVPLGRAATDAVWVTRV